MSRQVCRVSSSPYPPATRIHVRSTSNCGLATLIPRPQRQDARFPTLVMPIHCSARQVQPFPGPATRNPRQTRPHAETLASDPKGAAQGNARCHRRTLTKARSRLLGSAVNTVQPSDPHLKPKNPSPRIRGNLKPKTSFPHGNSYFFRRACKQYLQACAS